MANTSSYKCPSCGAPLNYDAASGMQHCDYCDSSFPIEEALIDNGEEGGSAFKSTAGSFQWGSYKKDLDLQQMEEVKTFVCENCGAEVVAQQVTASTTCPYCNNNVVIDERLSGGLKPNAIIPFTITKDQLPELLKNFYKDRPLLPKGFFAANKVEKAQGIYVPFWLFTATVDGSANLEGTTSHMFSTRDEDVVETSHYRLYREGEVRFAAVPVDGSRRMDDDVMDSVAPFDFEQLMEFKPEYLTGYVADRFDLDPDEELPRASARMEQSALDAFAETCTGYETVTPRAHDFQLKDTSVKYALLPIYLFNSEYQGKKYRYAINGQTGRVVGEVPTSKAKLIKSFVLPGGIAAVVVFVAMLLMELF